MKLIKKNQAIETIHSFIYKPGKDSSLLKRKKKDSNRKEINSEEKSAPSEML